MKRWGLPVIAVLAAALCVRLGFWQLDRLGQRRALSDAREARLAQPALHVERADDLEASATYRRVTASGAFDFVREVVEVGRSHRGVPGVHVVTPLRLPGGGAVLVMRGWAPSPDGRNVPLERLREPDTAIVEGVALPVGEASAPSDSTFPLYVRSASPAVLAARFPYPLSPVVLQRTELPATAPTALRAVAPPALGDGPHLWYAVQWFAFAAIALGGAGAFLKAGRMRGE